MKCYRLLSIKGRQTLCPSSSTPGCLPKRNENRHPNTWGKYSEQHFFYNCPKRWWGGNHYLWPLGSSVGTWELNWQRWMNKRKAYRYMLSCRFYITQPSQGTEDSDWQSLNRLDEESWGKVKVILTRSVCAEFTWSCLPVSGNRNVSSQSRATFTEQFHPAFRKEKSECSCTSCVQVTSA